MKARVRFSPAWVTNDMIFRPITGSTQGMKLRMNPASSAMPTWPSSVPKPAGGAGSWAAVSSLVLLETDLAIESVEPTCPSAKATRPFRQPFSSQY